MRCRLGDHLRLPSNGRNRQPADLAHQQAWDKGEHPLTCGTSPVARHGLKYPPLSFLHASKSCLNVAPDPPVLLLGPPAPANSPVPPPCPPSPCEQPCTPPCPPSPCEQPCTPPLPPQPLLTALYPPPPPPSLVCRKRTRSAPRPWRAPTLWLWRLWTSSSPLWVLRRARLRYAASHSVSHANHTCPSRDPHQAIT